MNNVLVLWYRHVTPNGGSFNCAPSYFRRQMAYLRQRGYRSLHIDQFEAFLRGEPVPKKSLLITFDGGYLDNFVYAYPILREHGLTAQLFVNTSAIKEAQHRRGHVGEGEILPYCPPHDECKRRLNSGHAEEVMMSWPELRHVQSQGVMQVHSFAHSMTRWDRQLNTEGKNQAMAAELAHSRECLQQGLGSCSAHLSWPHGYFDDDYLALARDVGFQYFYSQQQGVNQKGQSIIYRVPMTQGGKLSMAFQLWRARRCAKVKR